jgi:hypothetical protein
VLLNPAAVGPGSTGAVSGSGFRPGAIIDLYLKQRPDDRGEELGFVQTDQGGNFGGFSVTLPQTYTEGQFLIVAREQGSGKEAQAQGHIRSGSPKVQMGTQVGKPGDNVVISGSGFKPGEEVLVYFNTIAGDPIARLRADSAGGLDRESLRIPFGAVGNNAFIFLGQQSQAPVTVPFLLLNLYPTVVLSEYAARADTVLSFTGTGFGPEEKVQVHLNDPTTSPLAVLQADANGEFENAGSFRIPFSLRGRNVLIFVGQQSQAAVTVGFDVLPYTPTAEPSTYGGRPGTTITFYGSGFARDEIVRIYVGRNGQRGKEVACAKTDDQGIIRAGGSYTIPGNVQAGQMDFFLVGDKSQGEAVASVEVMEAGGPVDVPPEPAEYRCPFDAEAPAPGASPGAPPQTSPTSNATPQRTPEARPTRAPTPPRPTPPPKPGRR